MHLVINVIMCEFIQKKAIIFVYINTKQTFSYNWYAGPHSRWTLNLKYLSAKFR